MAGSNKGSTGFESRVTRIETSLGHLKIIGSIFIVALLSSIIAFLTYAGRLGERIAHLEGEKGDPLGATLKGIESPSSPQILSANLSLLASQVRVARVEKKHPKMNGVAKLSTAVASAADRNPELPEVWQAASQLVSYRSTEPVKNLGNCNKRPYSDLNPVVPIPPSAQLTDNINFHDCTIVLDDVEGFMDGGGGDHFRRVQAVGHGHVVTIYTFDRVHVIYRGGPVLPQASAFLFNDCTFEFDLHSPPPLSGRDITEQLLAAFDMNKIRVNIALS